MPKLPNPRISMRLRQLAIGNVLHRAQRLYLKAYDGVSAARADIADYMNWYDANRPHSSLDRLTPNEKYLTALPQMQQAA